MNRTYFPCFRSAGHKSVHHLGLGTAIPIGKHALTIKADYLLQDPRGPNDLGNQLNFSNMRFGVGFRF